MTHLWPRRVAVMLQFSRLGAVPKMVFAGPDRSSSMNASRSSEQVAKNLPFLENLREHTSSVKVN